MKINAKRVRDLKIDKNMKVSELVEGFASFGGFTAAKLANAAKILRQMDKENCFNFLSFPADIISTGVRGVIIDLIKEKKFDAIVTTCGTLDHDVARSFSDYYCGKFELDDAELHKKKIHRLGNVLIPIDNYGPPVEKFMRKMLNELYKSGIKEISTYELCWEMGKRLPKSSLLHWCAKNNVPMFVPGITDGAVGTQIFLFSQTHDFRINVLRDEKMLSNIVFDNKKTGALILGGGISKHHVIWWNQFKDGLDYAVYVTSAVEWDGSLSGAKTREAISWGKLKEKAWHENVEGDITIILPLLAASI